jgi:hypothetical protein
LALTTKTKALLSSLGAVVLVAGAVVGYLMFIGETDGIPFLGGDRGPVTCPLTGERAANENLAGRTAVGVKIENIAEARPQAGLNQADIVYEEPVEGGITRFIAVFHCENAERLGPIRSARLADPVVLMQYGEVAFAYSGAVQQVIDAVGRTDIQDISHDRAPQIYEEDPTRSAPHHLYSSTRTLLGAAEAKRSPPDPVFEYEEEPPAQQGSQRAREVHLDFSPAADVYWDYRAQRRVYLRRHGETPHTLEDGQQVAADNIVVMVVELRETGIVDAAGTPSPDVEVVGSGPAYVIRDGRVVRGTWERDGRNDVTRLLNRQGDTIPLSPGRTWVELFPSDREVDVG